ncbi:SDR family NAD(P)-dependent oxidoreductase [Rhizobium mayense]|uniref:SDR family oxidoreductase n=1 Tax=Rhizobium mayense TaxID=1312184 RepID=A0ABT7K2R7_9HYPH|nr:SDR family NAD(P)-dependent oxidoreductase [Rhizobium mayense]MDL2402482.1 SDR family oxidoreductase [Rhizobium mayense]
MAVVTGSTSGIGLGIACKLAAGGADLVINGPGDTSANEALCREIAKVYGVRVAFGAADLSNTDEANKLIGYSTDAMGRVDILVNNAGMQPADSAHISAAQQWDATIAVNLTAVWLTIRAVLPQMLERGWGRIINVAPMCRADAENKSAAQASKYGVIGLTKDVALDLVGRGVTCNVICPGWVPSPHVKTISSDAKPPNGRRPKARRRTAVGELQLSYELKAPDHLGSLAAFFCSDAAAQVNGVALPVDGGWFR